MIQILAASSPSDVEPIFVLLGLVLAAAVVVSLVFARLRQSLVLGYFLCGIILGNSKLLDVLSQGETQRLIAVLADSGVILLMFTLGIEFSLTHLKKLRKVAIGAGSLQMSVTMLVAAAALAVIGGMSWSASTLPALMLALSSTALALKLFQESGQANGPGARLALGIALFQDIAVIAFLLLMPVLYGGNGAIAPQLATALVRGVLFLTLAWLVTRFIIPPLLGSVSATRSRELFTLTVVALCAGIASAGWGLGLSLALGAFVAGLVVSESVYSHRILADVLPFKDVFLAVFFISVGLMIELPVFLGHWWYFLGLALLIFVVKAVILFFAGRAIHYPVRACVQAALALGSIGEFSLVLLNKSMALSLFSPSQQQTVLILTALSMAMAPIAMIWCAPLSRKLESLACFKHHVRAEAGSSHSRISSLENHAIICGYGPVGRKLDDALQRIGVETAVVELNVETVRELKALGRPVLFADASQAETLPLSGIERAALLAVTFPHFEAARSIVAHARTLNPGISVICRVKFDHQCQAMQEAGADEVVQDELESAVGVVSRALARYDASEDAIRSEENLLRFRDSL